MAQIASATAIDRPLNTALFAAMGDEMSDEMADEMADAVIDAAADAVRCALQAHESTTSKVRRVWLACSGGADSVVLLLGTHRFLVGTAGVDDLRVSHIDHGLSQHSAAWAGQVAELCATHAVPLQVHRCEPPIDRQFPDGLEAWARAQRYEHWSALLESGDVLLTAHQRDDQIETVALRLLQGRLPLPIPAARPLTGFDVGAGGREAPEPGAESGGWVLRPLLGVGADTGLRAAPLRAALRAIAVPWIDDESNTDTRLLRNRVRHELLPALTGRTDADGEEADRSGLDADGVVWEAALLRLGERVAQLQVNLCAVLERYFDTGAELDAATGELCRLPLAGLQQGAALMGVLEALGLPMISMRQAGDLTARLRAQPDQGGAGISLTGDVAQPMSVSLWRTGAAVVLWRQPENFTAPVTLQPTGSGRSRVQLPHGLLSLTDTSAPVVRRTSPSREPLKLRAVRRGDRLRSGGRERAVRELLRRAAVPRWARSSYPVLVCGDDVLLVPAPWGAGVAQQQPTDSGPAAQAPGGWVREGYSLQGQWLALDRRRDREKDRKK